MRDALLFSALWTFGVTVLAAVPLTVAIAHAVTRSRRSPDEQRAHELYVRLLEQEVYGDRCFGCRTPVEPEWLSCPVCTAQLHERCGSCTALLKPHWSVCPHCAASTDQPLPLRVAA